MAAQAQDVDLDIRVTCSVCLESYSGRQPKLLSCHHTFCLQCLSFIAQTSGCADDGSNNSSNNAPTFITCPTCRKESFIPPGGVAGFQTNFYVEGLNQTQPDVCDLCRLEGKETIVYCTECEKCLCLECFLQHDNEGHLVRRISSKGKPEEDTVTDLKVKEQLGMVQAVIELLQDEELELKHQARSVKEAIMTQHSTTLMQATIRARDDCLSRLRTVVEAHKSRLREEREGLETMRTALRQISSPKRITPRHFRPSTVADAKADLLTARDMRDLQERLKMGRKTSFVTIQTESRSANLRRSLQDFIGWVRSTSHGFLEGGQEDTAEEIAGKSRGIYPPDADSAAQASPPPPAASRDEDHSRGSISLGARVDNLMAQVADLKTENDAFRKELSALQDTNRQDLQALKDGRLSLLQEVTSMKEKNALLCQDVTSLGEASSKLCLDLSEMEEGTLRLRQDMTSIQEEWQARDKVLKTVENDLHLMCKDVTGLQGDNSKLFQSVEKIENDSYRLGQELESAKKESSQLRQDLDQADHNHSQLRLDLSEMEEGTLRLRQDMTSIQEEWQARDKVLKTVENDLHLMCKDVTGLQGDNAKLFQSVEKIENDSYRLGQELESAKKESSQLRQDLDQADHNHSQLREDLQRCLSEMTDLRQDQGSCFTQMMDFRQDLEQCLKDFRQDLRSCHINIVDTRKTLSSLENDLKSTDAVIKNFEFLFKTLIPDFQKSISSLKKGERTQKGQIRHLYKLIKQAGEVIAFHAVVDTERVIRKGQTLVVDHVITNIGGAYDNECGVFTAPVCGTYVFLVTTSSLQGLVRLDLVLEGTRIAHSFALADSRTTCHAVVSLTAGQRVWLMSLEADVTTFDSGWVTTFTGCLLRADVASAGVPM
ncbi:hypothetical protein C0Q70_05612 [Pomacea canaliculata]|uniref:C1q domain-containing protein n=2 Tax=Pomacea canaliculata TaxID=400727 RepID=A0A2T7PLN6_POMCA|nr:hypothetical protein C0Q70_05612 [Pomacea canaliculata]